MWRSRAPLDVANASDRPAAGLPVAVPIGKADGQLDLVGARARDIRVCDAAGVEMLFDLRAGQLLDELLR